MVDFLKRAFMGSSGSTSPSAPSSSTKPTSAAEDHPFQYAATNGTAAAAAGAPNDENKGEKIEQTPSFHAVAFPKNQRNRGASFRTRRIEGSGGSIPTTESACLPSTSSLHSASGIPSCMSLPVSAMSATTTTTKTTTTSTNSITPATTKSTETTSTEAAASTSPAAPVAPSPAPAPKPAAAKTSGGAQSVITQVSSDKDAHALAAAAAGLPVVIPPEPDPNSFIPLLPPKDPAFEGRHTLVLDLDETLVHASFKPLFMTDFTINIEIDGEEHEVSVRKRPHVDKFLARMSEIYEVVVLTASLELYADPVLDNLDPCRRWVHHRLFRDSCANLNGNYIKDLSFLGRPLHTVIIIDNSPTSYLFQPRNALACTSWFDDLGDTELRDFIPLLEQASKEDTIYTVLDTHRQKQKPQVRSPVRKF